MRMLPLLEGHSVQTQLNVSLSGHIPAVGGRGEAWAGCEGRVDEVARGGPAPTCSCRDQL